MDSLQKLRGLKDKLKKEAKRTGVFVVGIDENGYYKRQVHRR